MLERPISLGAPRLEPRQRPCPKASRYFSPLLTDSRFLISKPSALDVVKCAHCRSSDPPRYSSHFRSSVVAGRKHDKQNSKEASEHALCAKRESERSIFMLTLAPRGAWLRQRSCQGRKAPGQYSGVHDAHQTAACTLSLRDAR
jgi:hypothetical protein